MVLCIQGVRSSFRLPGAILFALNSAQSSVRSTNAIALQQYIVSGLSSVTLAEYQLSVVSRHIMSVCPSTGFGCGGVKIRGRLIWLWFIHRSANA